MARIISGILLIAVAVLAVIYATPAYFLIGIGLIGTACLYEYFGLTRAMGVHVQPWFGYIAFWLLLIDFRYRSLPIIVVLGLVLIVAFLSALSRLRRSARDRAFGLMAEVFGILYFALCLYPAIPVRYDFGDETSLHWTLLMLILIWVGDTAALAVGKTLGKTPLAPVLSPKKTYEGAVGGLLAGVGISIAAQQLLFPDLPLRHVIPLSVLLGILGQLGDLAESMLKRAAEAKDSSHLIPGHGGVLDRMDSLLFAFPVLYCYLSLLYT
jgi:phosphatidate cytidylyltransferase